MRRPFMLALMGLSIAANAEQKITTIPAPRVEIGSQSDVIYCDAILGSVLEESDSYARRDDAYASTLKAQVDVPADRLVIEIQGNVLYLHHREDFEKGNLYWGHAAPLKIERGRAGKGIIAYGYVWAPKSTGIHAVALNRASGIGMWTYTKDAIRAKAGATARDYPASTSMFLRCGSRKE